MESPDNFVMLFGEEQPGYVPHVVSSAIIDLQLKSLEID